MSRMTNATSTCIALPTFVQQRYRRERMRDGDSCGSESSTVNDVEVSHDVPIRRVWKAQLEAGRMELAKRIGQRVPLWLVVVGSIVLMCIGDLSASVSYGAHRVAYDDTLLVSRKCPRRFVDRMGR